MPLTADPIRTLLDRDELDDLVARLGAWLDDKRWDESDRIFAPDIEVSTPGGAAAGLEAVVDQARRSHDAYATQHVLTDRIIEVEGDTASITAKLVATFVLDGVPAFALGGRYELRARRGDAGWRLTRLVAVPVWREDRASQR